MNEDNVVAGVIADLTKDAIKALWERVKSHFKDLKEMTAIDFGSAYETYLEVSLEKIRMVKTLIYRREPRDLYAIYESVNLRSHDQIIQTDNVNNILALGHRLIITGTAGIGKTTMMKHIFINTLQSGYIPIFVELRGVNNLEEKNIAVSDLIYATLQNYGLVVEKQYFEYSMEEGRYLILFDGFDEVKTEKSNNLGQGIRELCTKYPDNYYIMSSRPMDQFIGWNDFKEVRAMTLDKIQALNLIARLDYAQATKEKFMYELNHGLFEKYRSFASNPLLLTIMLMTFDERASIPDNLNEFYEQAFSALFNIHDGSKDCFKRDIRTGLSSDDFKMIFSYFCFKTYFKNLYEFSESTIKEYLEYAKKQFPNIVFKIDDFLDDLVKSVCMIVKDGLVYTFSHRSFQEYFAAYYTTKLEDSDQNKLLSGWLSERKGYADDPFFLMLFNMQKNKCIKILLFPGIRKIKKIYNGKLSMDIIRYIFSDVGIQILNENGKKEYRVYLTIKDNYLCGILRMACLFTDYDFEKSNPDNHEFMAYATDNGNLDSGKVLEFEKIEEANMTENLMKQLSWLDAQIKHAISLIDRYGGKNTKNKRKVASIIDSL